MRNISTPNPGNTEENSQVKAREAMFAVIAVLSFLLNFLFCAIMTRKPKLLKRPHNILMFSLAITDLLTGLSSELSFIFLCCIYKSYFINVCLLGQHSTLDMLVILVTFDTRSCSVGGPKIQEENQNDKKKKIKMSEVKNGEKQMV